MVLCVGFLAGCKKSVPVSVVAVQPMQPQAQSAPASAVPANAEPVVRPSVGTTASAATDVAEAFGWKQYDQESFTTGPSQGRVFDVPLHATKLRVRVSASQAVFAGVMTRQQFSAHKGSVRAGNFLSAPCGFVGRAGGERTCALDPLSPEEFVLRDVREQQMMVDPRMKQGANRIAVTLSVWACVAHCRAVEAK